MSLLSQGNVFIAEIELLNEPSSDRFATKVVNILQSLSMERMDAGLAYLNWKATNAKFGYLRTETEGDHPGDYACVGSGVTLFTRTNHEVHKGMTHDVFAYLVQVYAEYLAGELDLDQIEVSFLGRHDAAVYEPSRETSSL